MGLISNAVAGAFSVPGSYVQEVAAQPVTPQGPNSSLLMIDGVGSWGKTNSPIPTSDVPSSIAAIGDDDTHANSILSEVLSAVPEAQSFLLNRVTDGTDTAATISIVDASAGIVATLTAVCTGVYGNKATARVDLVAGTPTASPVYRVSIFFPNASPNIYNNIVASSGGTYSKTIFQANLLAAINGTAPNSTPNPYFVATAGSSTLAPVTASVIAASGGTNGNTSITSAVMLGTDALVGRTGAYAFRGLGAGGVLIMAGMTDATQYQTLATLAQQENFRCVVLLGASGTTTATAVSTIQTDALSSNRLIGVMDWLYINDPLQGQTRLVSPLGGIAGVVSSLAPWQDPLNKPYVGKVGVLATERTAGQPISQGEAGQRASNNILYMTKPIPRGNVMGLADDHCLDGSLIADGRMMDYIAVTLQQIGGQFVGELQANIPNDPTRADFEGAINDFLQPLKTSGYIADKQVICDQTNNSQTTITEGFLIANVLVTTKTGVRYTLSVVQVGNTVVVQNTTPLAAAA